MKSIRISAPPRGHDQTRGVADTWPSTAVTSSRSLARALVRCSPAALPHRDSCVPVDRARTSSSSARDHGAAGPRSTCNAWGRASRSWTCSVPAIPGRRQATRRAACARRTATGRTASSGCNGRTSRSIAGSSGTPSTRSRCGCACSSRPAISSCARTGSLSSCRRARGGRRTASRTRHSPSTKSESAGPQIDTKDITAVLYEPNAGVVRARRSTEAVAEVFQQEGGRLIIGRVVPPSRDSFDGTSVRLDRRHRDHRRRLRLRRRPMARQDVPADAEPDAHATRHRASTSALRLAISGSRFRTCRAGTFVGTTGWPGLPVDNRGFRVRGGGGGGGGDRRISRRTRRVSEPGDATEPVRVHPHPVVADPDLSVRWVEPERLVRTKQFVADRFPALKDAPIVQTWACHYESTSSRNFVDRSASQPAQRVDRRAAATPRGSRWDR